MAGVESRNFDSPDETRTPDKTRVRACTPRSEPSVATTIWDNGLTPSWSARCLQ
jgi:hypothetical protein